MIRRLLPTAFALFSVCATTNAATDSWGQIVVKGIFRTSTFVEDTTVIPAVLGTYFGVVVKVRPTLRHTSGFNVVRITWRFPAAGLTNPKSGQTLHVLHGQCVCPPDRDCRLAFKFGQPWELVPGVWEIEFAAENRPSLKQSFTVVEP